MVDKTMMGDKCAELVRAAMIGALAVTLGNPTAVYAAEEETADPGQIGIEIAGEAAVGAASFCVEEDAAEEEPAEAEEVTEPEGTQNDEMEEESGSEGKEDETVPEEPEPQKIGTRRLGRLLVATPLVMLVAAGIGWSLHPLLSRLHPTVQLAERIAAEEAGTVTGTPEYRPMWRGKKNWSKSPGAMLPVTTEPMCSPGTPLRASASRPTLMPKSVGDTWPSAPQ